MEGRLLLNVVVRESAAILELLAGEDKSLLIGRDTFLILNLGLDVIDGVGGLDLEGDSLTGEGLDEDLHNFWLLVFINYKLEIAVRFYREAAQP